MLTVVTNPFNLLLFLYFRKFHISISFLFNQFQYILVGFEYLIERGDGCPMGNIPTANRFIGIIITPKTDIDIIICIIANEPYYTIFKPYCW